MPQPDLLEATIHRTVPVVKSARVQQLLGMFDIPPSERTEQSWTVKLALPAEWNVGLIVPASCSWRWGDSGRCDKRQVRQPCGSPAVREGRVG